MNSNYNDERPSESSFEPNGKFIKVNCNKFIKLNGRRTNNDISFLGNKYVFDSYLGNNNRLNLESPKRDQITSSSPMNASPTGYLSMTGWIEKDNVSQHSSNLGFIPPYRMQQHTAENRNGRRMTSSSNLYRPGDKHNNKTPNDDLSDVDTFRFSDINQNMDPLKLQYRQSDTKSQERATELASQMLKDTYRLRINKDSQNKGITSQ